MGLRLIVELGSKIYLYESYPIAIKDTLSHEVFYFLGERSIHGRGLGCNLRDECICFLLFDAFLEKDLGGLGEDDAYQELDDFATEIRRRRV